jgi:NADPH:quinone reductase-like Zn-dependent oxidoreductase
MRAAVIRRSGATPALDQFADPQPGRGLSVGTLLAAALNPLDIAIVNDQFPIRRLQPPYVAGYEAVVQLGDGTRCYLTGPPAPYGTLAELVPVPDSAGFPVPAGIDPSLAAALGVAGLVGWLALDYRGHLHPGETVLVLGAGGSAGQLAMQSARRAVTQTRGHTLSPAHRNSNYPQPSAQSCTRSHPTWTPAPLRTFRRSHCPIPVSGWSP